MKKEGGDIAKKETQYLHLSEIDVKDGQVINEKDKIGEIGGSRMGDEFGGQVHLHYQILKLNKETGKYENYNPTEGKGNSEKNIVDPQTWVTNSSSSSNSEQGSNENSLIKYINIIWKEVKEFINDKIYPGTAGSADKNHNQNEKK